MTFKETAFPELKYVGICVCVECYGISAGSAESNGVCWAWYTLHHLAAFFFPLYLKLADNILNQQIPCVTHNFSRCLRLLICSSSSPHLTFCTVLAFSSPDCAGYHCSYSPLHCALTDHFTLERDSLHLLEYLVSWNKGSPRPAKSYRKSFCFLNVYIASPVLAP